MAIIYSYENTGLKSEILIFELKKATGAHKDMNPPFSRNFTSS